MITAGLSRVIASSIEVITVQFASSSKRHMLKNKHFKMTRRKVSHTIDNLF